MFDTSATQAIQSIQSIRNEQSILSTRSIRGLRAVRPAAKPAGSALRAKLRATRSASLLLLLASGLAGCATEPPSLGTLEPLPFEKAGSWNNRFRGDLEGLTRVRDSRVDEAYRRSDVDWSRYRGVFVEPVRIADDLDTDEDHYSQSQLDIVRRALDERIRSELGDWLASETGSDVLQLRVLITHLVANDPPFDARRQYSGRVDIRGIGSAGAQFELRGAYAGDSDALLAAWVDLRRGDPLTARFLDRRPAWEDVRRAFSTWARHLRSTIDHTLALPRPLAQH